MAIHPTPAPHPISIEAWTEQAAASLANLTLHPPPPPVPHSTLTIDLDPPTPAEEEDRKNASRPRRQPLRRDSLKRREELLKGKEGSRRRRQWENDRLLSNPWAQPPLPSDWEVHPTHPRHNTVPYYLAGLWEQEGKARAEARKREQQRSMLEAQGRDEGQGKVARELRERLKRARGAKGLLRELEEQVRVFVAAERGEMGGDEDEGEEEIVFVGRNGRMRDVSPEAEVEGEKLVFRSLEDDRGGRFYRWLVHSIATYYGLPTWSITVGDPALREAYVGIPPVESGPALPSLPRPLWGMV